MRRIGLLMFAAAALAACSSQETTSPSTVDDSLLDAGAYGTALTEVGGYDAEIYETRVANGLPEEIRLSDDQKAEIKALVKAFQESTKADRKALAEIIRRARSASKGGQSAEHVKAIMDEGAEIRARLAAAEAKLKSDIHAILTQEQRDWIASHSPKRCDPAKFPALTDAQKADIHALEAAFAAAHKADIEAVKAAFEAARAAGRASKSKEEVAKFLESVRPAIERLATARAKLRNDIIAVLTAEQRASGCLPLG